MAINGHRASIHKKMFQSKFPAVGFFFTLFSQAFQDRYFRKLKIFSATRFGVRRATVFPRYHPATSPADRLISNVLARTVERFFRSADRHAADPDSGVELRQHILQRLARSNGYPVNIDSSR